MLVRSLSHTRAKPNCGGILGESGVLILSYRRQLHTGIHTCPATTEKELARVQEQLHRHSDDVK